MKRSVTVAAIGLFGCVDQPELGTTATLSFDEFRAAAATHREPGTDAYIVDGDIAIHGDDALHDYWMRSQQGALTIYAVGGVDVMWDLTQRLDLTYCVGSGFGANKPLIVAALTQATENGWMKFANVKFRHVPAQDDAACTGGNGNVVFDVNQVDSGNQYLARAFFPNDSRSQRNVLVDPDSFTVSWPLANILAHELGHTLGFRHEHIRLNNECAEDNNYRAITAYDSASVMHYPQCGGTSTDLAFTMLDKQGVEMVYDKPAAPNVPPMTMINTPKDGAVVQPTFRVESSLVDADLTKGELFIDGALYKTLPLGGPYEFQVRDADEGPHQLVVKATDSINQVTAQTINVTVMAPVVDEPKPDDDGGCTAGGSSAGGGLIVALGLVAARRRRTR